MKIVNTPESREGNLIRYIVYLVGYLMAAGVVKLNIWKAPLKIWDFILFVLVSAMVMLFFIYRFNREQRFFRRSHQLNLVGDLGFTIGLTILVTGLRIIVMYFQLTKHIDLYGFQITYDKFESVDMFYFMVVSEGILLPILQEFLATGFLFNYAFRRDDRSIAILGIVASGLLFSLLSFQFSIPLLLINWLFGMIFAWSYLYTQSIWMPMYLAVLNGLLMVIMI